MATILLIPQSAALHPGAPAPKLEIKRWVKGEPMSELPEKGVCVVEFWATWCGPCIESIPHLTQLAKANKDVKFIGVSIWEDDNETTINNFVKKMGPKMDYRVAYSGNKDGMSASWMEAAKQNGIPTAFLIKDRVVQWIGHPLTLPEPLSQLQKGKLSIEAENTKFSKSLEAQASQETARNQLGEIEKLYEGGDHLGAIAKLKAFVTDHPGSKKSADQISFQWSAEQDPAAFQTAVDKILAKNSALANDDLASTLRTLALREPARATAVKAMDKLLKAAKDQNLIVMYYGVKVYESAKETAKCQGVAKRALKFMDSHKDQGSDTMRKIFEKAAQ